MRAMRLCSTQSHSRLCSLSEVQEFLCCQAAGPEDKSQAVTIASAMLAELLKRRSFRDSSLVGSQMCTGCLFRQMAAWVWASIASINMRHSMIFAASE